MPRVIQNKEKEKLDLLIIKLSGQKHAWPLVDFCRRRKILEQCLANTLKYAPEWVNAAVEKKGLVPETTAAAEEVLAGPVVLARHLRLMITSLRQIEREGVPRCEGPLREIPNSCLLASKVFPLNRLDRIAFGGIEAEVWQAPEVTRANFDQQRARVYRAGPAAGRLCLVLGAGNVSSIGPLDVLYKLFHENEVCLLKMNPVNDYLGFVFERILAPLVLDGFLGFAHGDAKVGRYLVEHPQVDTIHLTGSDRTFDAIVWGAPGEQEVRKRTGEKQNHRAISAELGNVSPMIVMPGKWKAREIEFQARSIASSVANNGSFNCNATKLLITPKDWKQRDVLLDRVRALLAETPERKAYYPGAQQRYHRFLDAHPEAERLSRGVKESVVPWTLIAGLDPECGDEICFREEAFCGILAEVPLESADPQDFLMRAVRFCNERLWGTLSAAILIPPKLEKRYPALVDAALLELRYGTVGINIWPALGYALAVTPWGAYPGHRDEDIQSGRGWVHNTLFFDNPIKSVVRAPFHLPFSLPYFVTHRTAYKLSWQLLAMEADPSWGKLAGVVFQSLLGG